MKFFFSYDKNGDIKVIHNYSPGGWPECDCSPGCSGLENPDCQMPAIVSIRSNATEDVVGYIGYNCSCPSSSKHCSCDEPNFVVANKIVVDGQLVDKPPRHALINNEEIDGGGETIQRAPGNILSFKVSSPEAIDGNEVDVKLSGAMYLYPQREFKLVFSGGETNTVDLVAPAHGGFGILTATASRMRPINFTVVGWAV